MGGGKWSRLADKINYLAKNIKIHLKTTITAPLNSTKLTKIALMDVSWLNNPQY
ncbi:hypothetical protein V8V69_10595 [Niallia circulans]